MMESHIPFMFETKKTVIQYKSGSMKENLHGCMAAGEKKLSCAGDHSRLLAISISILVYFMLVITKGYTDWFMIYRTIVTGDFLNQCHFWLVVEP